MIIGISSSPAKLDEPKRPTGIISMRTAIENWDEIDSPETVYGVNSVISSKKLFNCLSNSRADYGSS
jgi:hypothetical protein